METIAAPVVAPVVVKKSRPGLGQGLFAASTIYGGFLVAEYSGKRIPTLYADTLKSRYLFEIDDEWTIEGSSPDNIARYINHSCEPNCEAKLQGGRVFVYAVRDIPCGEELTLDYGSEYFDEFIQPAGCKCDRCAGVFVLSETPNQNSRKKHEYATEDNLNEREPKTQPEEMVTDISNCN